MALAIDRHEHHDVVKEALAEHTAPNSILFCRATQMSFLRLLTTAVIYKPYNLPVLTNQQAWKVFELFESMPNVAFVEESGDIDKTWRTLSALPTSSPKVWMDTYLATFAISHDYTFLTLDSNFRAYPNLKLRLLS